MALTLEMFPGSTWNISGAVATDAAVTSNDVAHRQRCGVGEQQRLVSGRETCSTWNSRSCPARGFIPAEVIPRRSARASGRLTVGQPRPVPRGTRK